MRKDHSAESDHLEIIDNDLVMKNSKSEAITKSQGAKTNETKSLRKKGRPFKNAAKITTKTAKCTSIG